MEYFDWLTASKDRSKTIAAPLIVHGFSLIIPYPNLFTIVLCLFFRYLLRSVTQLISFELKPDSD